MHENKYLHLPVLNQATGQVVGVVNVMEIIQSTAGDNGSERYGKRTRKQVSWASWCGS